MHHARLVAPSGLSRRAMVGRAGALGLALATRGLSASAQDATPAATPFPRRDHPVIGVWQWDNAPYNPGQDLSHAIFSVDGGYVEGVWRYGEPQFLSLGTWRATGERTADLVFTSQPIVPRDLFDPTQVMEGNALATDIAGLLVWRLALTVDATGNTLTQTGGYDIFDRAGKVIQSVVYAGIGTRMAPVAPATAATPTA